MLGGLFRFFFVYPPTAWGRGRLTLLSPWPRWLLLALILAGAAALAWQLRRRFAAAGATRSRAIAVWALQSSMLVLLLLLLWRPALVVTAAVPGQNVAAVLLDDSASMALEQRPRVEAVKEVFGAASPIVARMQERFQVRMYRFSEKTARVPDAGALGAAGKATRLEDALRDVTSELNGMPLAAVVLVTDGAANSTASTERGPEQSALAELKARRIPLHTVGVGLEHFERDLQVDDVTVAATVPAGGVVSGTVAVRQEGYAGKTVPLEVRENGTLVQSVPVTFERGSQTMAVRVNFTPRRPGVNEYTFLFAAQPDEPIARNNVLSRVVTVEERKAKLLYVEGHPRWEYKFIRRALEDDPTIQLTTLLRTSANKFYRQGVESESVLESGFPKEEELFGFEGVLLGSIESGFFSGDQLQSVYDFVSRRGGGLLALGGVNALADGGYQNTSLADVLPVTLSGAKTYQRREARVELTAHGADSPMLQLGGDAQKSAARWKALPTLGDYQRTGEPKPGAVVLARATVSGERASLPLLVSQRFGRGRAFLFATSSSWRWQMELDHRDDSHELFWRQLLRALVTDTPASVRVSTDSRLYRDERHVNVRAEVLDKKFQPVENATVSAAIVAPDGSRHELPLEWSAREPGLFTGNWEANGTGTFAVELVAKKPGPNGPEEVGRNMAYFQRTEGTLEYYNAQQNRTLLQSLAEQTGGRYYTIDRAAALPAELVYTEAGITEQRAHELWHLPATLLLLLALKGSEWGLRKSWGSV